jgi:hypothetical protein
MILQFGQKESQMDLNETFLEGVNEEGRNSQQLVND